MNAIIQSSDLYFFSRERLFSLADEFRDQFQNAEPYEHIAIDNFLPQDVAERIAGAFPAVGEINWRLEGPGDSIHTGDAEIEKITCADEEQFPPYIRAMMLQFQSGIFCRFLDRLGGYEQLLPDANNYGCGLHSTGNGGRLMLHIDASRHPDKNLNQVINCIYYCSPDWKPDWGGELELWDEGAERCVTKIAPKFNRLVVFRVSGKSWHGQPQPLRSPAGSRRNSLAMYYYSTDKKLTGYNYSNFVRWKAVTEHDKRSSLHVVKGLVRDALPTPLINAAATVARKTGLNFKRRR